MRFAPENSQVQKLPAIPVVASGDRLLEAKSVEKLADIRKSIEIQLTPIDLPTTLIFLVKYTVGWIPVLTVFVFTLFEKHSTVEDNQEDVFEGHVVIVIV